MTHESQAPEGGHGPSDALDTASRMDCLAERLSGNVDTYLDVRKAGDTIRELVAALAAQPEWRCPETGRTCTPEDCDASPAEGDALAAEQIEAARIEVFMECGADLRPEVAASFARALVAQSKVQPKRRDADHDVWMNDYFTLLGDAEIRRMGGETDMPNYLLELAGRIAKAHLEEGYVQRAAELRAAAPVPSPAPGAEAGEWRNYWADKMQAQADADKAAGRVQSVGYYVWSAFLYAHASPSRAIGCDCGETFPGGPRCDGSCAGLYAGSIDSTTLRKAEAIPWSAIREVIRISDRSHPAWDEVKDWLEMDGETVQAPAVAHETLTERQREAMNAVVAKHNGYRNGILQEMWDAALACQPPVQNKEQP